MARKYSQKEFESLVNPPFQNPFNRLIGNFLYLHREANPQWFFYFDKDGNVVQYGGRGDATDVIVRIDGDSVDRLVPKLYAYMKELVGRHGEELHEEGEKKFHGVTISLPYKALGSNNEFTIHTGSGCCYDQDEIAYEVMAALSGVPVYKAISPFDSYYDFKRLDKIDDRKWIIYWHHKQGIKVEFNHVDDHSSVVVSKSIHEPRSDWEKFQQLMYEFVEEYVRNSTGGRSIPHEPGHARYFVEGSDRTLAVDITSGSSFSFSVQVPYRQDFARLTFAKEVMEMLSREFKVKSQNDNHS